MPSSKRRLVAVLVSLGCGLLVLTSCTTNVVSGGAGGSGGSGGSGGVGGATATTATTTTTGGGTSTGGADCSTCSLECGCQSYTNACCRIVGSCAPTMSQKTVCDKMKPYTNCNVADAWCSGRIEGCGHVSFVERGPITGESFHFDTATNLLAGLEFYDDVPMYLPCGDNYASYGALPDWNACPTATACGILPDGIWSGVACDWDALCAAL